MSLLLYNEQKVIFALTYLGEEEELHLSNSRNLPG